MNTQSDRRNRDLSRLRQEGTTVTVWPGRPALWSSEARPESGTAGSAYSTVDAQKALEMLDREVQRLLVQSRKNVTACERNAARGGRAHPPALAWSTGTETARFFERLPEKQSCCVSHALGTHGRGAQPLVGCLDNRY